MDHIPIDIHVNKLTDWLLSRKVCKNIQNIDDLKEKLRNFDKMFGKFIPIALLSYPEIKLHFTKKQDIENKNMFGKYESHYMNELKSILDVMEKDKLYLYHMAQLLAANCAYEIPYLKKETSKANENISTNAKRVEELKAKHNLSLNDFNNECKALNIKGHNFELELRQCLNNLPSILMQINQNLQAIRSSQNFYIEYLSEIKNICDGDMYKNVLPQIHELLSLPMEKIDLQSDKNITNETQKACDEFGIEVLEEGTENDDKQTVSRLNYDNYILSKKSVRTNLLHELKELQAFLQERNFEPYYAQNGSDASKSIEILYETLANKPKFESFFKFLKDNEHLAHSTKNAQLSKINSYLESVDKFISYLTLNTEVTSCFMILDDPGYIDKICDGLKRKLAHADKMRTLAEEMELKGKDLEKATQIYANKQADLIKQNKIIKQRIEKEISLIYNKRPVNIIGVC